MPRIPESRGISALSPAFARVMVSRLLFSPAARTWGLGFIALAFLVLFWQIATVYRIDMHIRFGNVPTPGAVLARAWVNATDPVFLKHVVISLRRILAGFCLAASVAVPLGLLMGRFDTVRALVFPAAEVLRPIPAIAWVPLSVMLWPSTEESIVFITFLGSFFPILLNTLHGAAAIEPSLLRAARSLGAGEFSVFREVYLPGAAPQIFTGLSIGMGVAWVSLIAAEMISGQFGIGYFTWEAYALVRYPDIVLGMLLIGGLGLASSGGLRLAARIAMPWYGPARRMSAS